MIGLTPRQAELLGVIRAYLKDHNGVAPTFEQMADAIGLKSKSGISRMLGELEARGLIRRLPGLSRSIEVVDRALLDEPTEKLLDRYCEKTRADRRAVVVDAMHEYFAKRRFPEADR